MTIEQFNGCKKTATHTVIRRRAKDLLSDGCGTMEFCHLVDAVTCDINMIPQTVCKSVVCSIKESNRDLIEEATMIEMV